MALFCYGIDIGTNSARLMLAEESQHGIRSCYKMLRTVRTGEGVRVSVTVVFGFAGETLFLNAGHVKYIKRVDGGFERCDLDKLLVMLHHILTHIVRNGELTRGNQREMHVRIAGKCFAKYGNLSGIQLAPSTSSRMAKYCIANYVHILIKLY